MQQAPHPDSAVTAALRKPPASLDIDFSATDDEWLPTQPGDLLPSAEAHPFRESLMQGLSMREMFEPRVFRWFFGRGKGR